uniref:Citrate transport protein n=1 Tax=Setaria digitata TaxID=48799 RepID=A0A915PWF5_9BILA
MNAVDDTNIGRYLESSSRYNFHRFLPTDKSVKGVLIGGLTGGIEICITFPTEYVKTQLQLDERSLHPVYKGPMDCVKKTVRTNGFLGLYRGLPILVYGSIPKSALRFGTFEALKGHAVNSDGNLTPMWRFLCGFGAGLSEAVFAVTPMETIKVKFIHDQQLAKPKFKSFFGGLKTIIQTEGFRGLYQGVTATMAKQGSNQAIRFFVMETLKDWYRGGDNSKTVSKPATAVFGVFAGACSVYGNTPIDVVKTRMQGLEAKKYKNTINCAYQIFKTEGFFAFYKGTVPRLCRVCFDVALTFTLYDSIMEYANKLWKT